MLPQPHGCNSTTTPYKPPMIATHAPLAHTTSKSETLTQISGLIQWERVRQGAPRGLNTPPQRQDAASSRVRRSSPVRATTGPTCRGALHPRRPRPPAIQRREPPTATEPGYVDASLLLQTGHHALYGCRKHLVGVSHNLKHATIRGGIGSPRAVMRIINQSRRGMLAAGLPKLYVFPVPR